MNPNQPPANQPPNGYPPNTPAPAPAPQPPATPYQPQPQPTQPQQPMANQPVQPTAPAAADWYTPPAPKDNGPASANDYVNKFKQPQDPAGFGGGGGNESHSIDYLNKLAGTTTPTKSAAPANQKIILIGVGVFLALSLAVLLLIFANQKGPSGPPAEQTLYTTIFNSAEISSEASKHIKNSQLSSLNSAYHGQLVNDLTAMSEPLAKRGIDAKELGKAAKKAAEFEEVLQKLEDARLNAVYDKTYAAELDYQLQSIIMLMEKVEKLSSNKDMVEFVKKGSDNYTTIQDGLKDYNQNLAPGN